MRTEAEVRAMRDRLAEEVKNGPGKNAQGVLPLNLPFVSMVDALEWVLGDSHELGRLFGEEEDPA